VTFINLNQEILVPRSAHNDGAKRCRGNEPGVARFREGYPGWIIHSTHHFRAQRGEQSEYLLVLSAADYVTNFANTPLRKIVQQLYCSFCPGGKTS
jgi:hypothetical protein